MVLDINRPPLPAPTEPSTLDSADDSNLRDDVDTNVSTRTDKTSYSVPEDGTPITINTTKPQGILHKKYPSQTSLLIEYFEAGKEEGSVRSRPSVRVKVTPSSRKSKSTAGSDHVQITKTSVHPRKPAYTRRISLGSRPRNEIQYTRTAEWSDDDVSTLPPVEIEVLPDISDLSESNAGRFIPMASDVSSMPPDSTLGGKIEILPPGRRRSRSLEREAVTEAIKEEEEKAKLTAPQERRSRSLSKDRIAQRVMEKLAQQQALDDSTRSSRSTSKVGKEEITSPRSRTHKRRSKDVEEVSALSGTESSLLSSNAGRRSHDTRSGVSGTSSLNNPKLLATVEDAIKRLILPELNALKEETRTVRNRDKFDRDSKATYETVESKDGTKRRMSKSSSAPKLHGSKPKVVLNRDGDNPGTILSGNSSRKGERRSSKGSISSYAESTRDEKSSHSRRKSKDKSSSSRDAEIAALAGAGLTAAALKHHTSREEEEAERKHRKRHSSRNSRSRSASISDSVDDTYIKAPIPPLPFNHSELIGGSELTRNSILSAETDTKDRPESRDSHSSRSTRVETPLHDVARGFASPGPRTPNALQQALRMAHNNRTANEALLASPRSDRSAKNREHASLEAAAAAKVRAIEQSEPHASQYEIESETPTRGASPVQSEASYRERDVVANSPQRMGSIRSGPSVSSLGRHFERHQSSVSIASMESTASTKAARTRKRPQGVTLESKRSILNESTTPQDAKDFFESNHEKNEMYRRELEGSEIASEINDKRMTSYTDDSADVQYLDREPNVDMQDVQKVGSTPEYIHTPLAVESAVASLHDPSSISVRSSGVSSPLRKSMLSQVSPGLDGYMQSDRLQTEGVPSSERWGAIRNKAEALVQQNAAEDSPRQSVAKSVDEQPQMHHSAFPGDEMMPEIGYGVDDDSDVTTNPSIIQGPLGGPDGFDDHEDELDREQTPKSFAKGAAFGAATGAAALGAAAAHQLRDNSPDSFDQRHQATVEDDYDQPYPGEPQYEQEGYAHSTRTPLSGPSGWKDEGYQSANHGEGFTPQNRNYSKIFEDDEFGDGYDEPDLFAANGSHSRQASGNSHGMDSPLYDSATGKGLDRIQSKDIVALMDHLTVRDAQRNARDTEILVTLVRSAAEMRTQIDELKQFIKTEDNMIMQTTDKRLGLAEQRMLNGPRAQPVSSPRINRSSTEETDIETKKKSIFRRALKGLGSKDGGDMKHIEEMLVQLLGEVESLKQTQQLSLDQQHERSNSLNSYENLRASGHSGSGYEPEGRANTASSPDQSGYLSNPASSRRIQDLHSGYDVIPTNRISTVNEEDEDEDYDNRGMDYENTERMLTPTQEAFQNKRNSLQSPPQASRGLQEPQSQENTPKRKHKSNSSSIFGIPKISRWSKTTSSTNAESVPRNSSSADRRPYSTHSRSNSQTSVDYYDEHDDDYERRQDGRRQAEAALNRDDDSYRSVRSPSPLIPEDQLQYELEDPKYKAHRNSLNLQHPQPRAGPTGRHQNHLETQARIYEPIQSPDFDQWGSMPALARNRLSGGPVPHNMSPLSSVASYSEVSEPQHQAAPLRMSKMADDGPLIPPPQTLAGFGQTRQMYSSPNEFGSQGALTPLAPIAEVRYSLETDRGHRMTPTPSPRPSNQHLRASAAMNSPQRKITGPRPMGSRSPAPQSPLQHSDTVVRRKPIQDDEESLESYRSSLDSEIF